ncbi:MAG: hypothetical protein ACLTV6_07325 [Christensenellales bacterium]
MDQWAFFDEFKAGTVRNVYLFYGPEAYIRKAHWRRCKKLLMPGLEARTARLCRARRHSRL